LLKTLWISKVFHGAPPFYSLTQTEALDPRLVGYTENLDDLYEGSVFSSEYDGSRGILTGFR
jgi:hypothetical protein